jgi:hypothetical protein
MGKGRSVHNVLIGKSERKRLLRRSRRRWEDKIMMDLRKLEIDGANWIRLAQDIVQWQVFVTTVMKLLAP